MPSIEECVDKAEECERQAQAAPSETMKKYYLLSAASWRRLAVFSTLPHVEGDLAVRPQL